MYLQSNQKGVSQLILRREDEKYTQKNGLLFKDLRLLSEMAQWAQALATNSDNLSSIPGTHMIEGKN